MKSLFYKILEWKNDLENDLKRDNWNPYATEEDLLREEVKFETITEITDSITQILISHLNEEADRLSSKMGEAESESGEM